MSKKISVHVDLAKSDKELDEERKKAYYNEHKTRIRTYYKEWYDEQKEAK